MVIGNGDKEKYCIHFRLMGDITIWNPEEVGKVDQTLVKNKKITQKNMSLISIKKLSLIHIIDGNNNNNNIYYFIRKAEQ